MHQYTQSQTDLPLFTFYSARTASKNSGTNNPAQYPPRSMLPYMPVHRTSPIDFNGSLLSSTLGPRLKSPYTLLPLTTPLTHNCLANASTEGAIPATSQIQGALYLARLSIQNIGSTKNLLVISREDWTKSNKITTLNAYLQDKCERNSANQVSNPSQLFITWGSWCCLTSRRVHGRP